MQYDPRYHQRTSNLESELAAYGEDALVVKQQRTNRPARHLGNTKQVIIAERLARQQAIDEARARQLNGRGNTRRPTDASPQVRKRQVQQEDDEVEDDELYEDEDLSTRAPRSAVRYRAEEIYQDGNTSIYAGQLFIPKKRRSAEPQRAPAHQYQQEQYTNDIDEDAEAERPRYRRRTPPWYLLLALGAVIALILWISGAWVNKWWTDTQNDWTYRLSFVPFPLMPS